MQLHPLAHTSRTGKWVLLLLALVLVLGGVGAPLRPATAGPAGVPAVAPIAAPLADPSPSVRWGFYVTYNPNSLVSLRANVDKLNYVSPWFYSVNGDGIVTNSVQPDVNALLAAHAV